MNNVSEQEQTKSAVALTEEKILAFWEEKDIFKKTLEKESPQGEFVFFDGPPFATGEAHYGHAVPGTVKDVIPRYKTMRGYHVRRRWGWDCHGLPVENLIEKELKLASKKDIIDYGIGKFNEAARASVMRYADDWRRVIPRLGRWVDMENDYRTMDTTYTESVWWAFSELHKKGLIYEGFKSMNLCPRCETTLSNFEVSQGYKDITDISVYVKFKVKGKENTFFLAWTTTPWTLPGNVALAINPDITYTTINVKGENIILAQERLSVVKEEYAVVSTVKGSELVGMAYEPVFPYYAQDEKLVNKNQGWKVYGASFVTTTDGSGIVHIAPAFGSDDYELSLVHKLPFVQHVTTHGVFKSEVTDFAGMEVKPKNTPEEKDKHQKADIEIIKYLARTGNLFAKEKIIHSYPHCWRCDTPLLNYAASSWFVRVTEIRDKLVKENEKVAWTPSEIGEGRFGNWLKGARDWAISRSRFWGAPLPVWKDTVTGEYEILSSIKELASRSTARNTYFTVRHGEAENNTLSVVSSHADNPHHLTALGKEQARKAGEWLKNKGIDMIFVSPFIRTQETASIIAEVIGLSSDKIMTDIRLKELDAGVWNNKPFADFLKNFAHANRFDTRPEGGENYVDIKKRMGDMLYDLESRYEGKKILIVSHDSPLFLLRSAAQGLDQEQSLALRGSDDHYNHNAEPQELVFSPLPHNENYEIDLHRPYIDDVKLVSKKGNPLVRIPEVFDCWFESGSMPFGESHYPFEKDEFDPHIGLSHFFKKSKGYPADFIAEGLDQTRGWFYSMLVLGVGLFGSSPYKHVIVNGLVLAEDGQKMSKSKKNYPDIRLMINKYGADALRYYLMASPLVHAQDFCFSEKGVDEVVKKHIGRLNNVVTFYEMYAQKGLSSVQSTHPLDIWIRTRVSELTREVTQHLEVYAIDKATRPFADFIDDLSTWYLRRSRDRFKSSDAEDKAMALSTTRDVLLDVVTLLAPFMPFVSEDIYMRIKGEGDEESVHLRSWPQVAGYDEKILTTMSEARKIASLGLEARMRAKINVRQPLARLTLKNSLDLNLVPIVEDEVNVKEIRIDPQQNEELVLDTVITDILKEEGTLRELMRAIQDLRKEKGLTIHDRALLKVETDERGTKLIEKAKTEIVNTTTLKDIIFTTLSGDMKSVGDISVKIDIEK